MLTNKNVRRIANFARLTSLYLIITLHAETMKRCLHARFAVNAALTDANFGILNPRAEITLLSSLVGCIDFILCYRDERVTYGQT